MNNAVPRQGRHCPGTKHKVFLFPAFAEVSIAERAKDFRVADTAIAFTIQSLSVIIIRFTSRYNQIVKDITSEDFGI